MTVPEAPKTETNALFYLCVLLCVAALVMATAFLAFTWGVTSAKESTSTVVQPVVTPTPTPMPVTTETRLITVSSCVAGGYGILATDGTLYQTVNYVTWSQFEPRDTYSVVITDGKIVSAVLVASHYYDGGINYEYHNEYQHDYRDRNDYNRRKGREDTKSNAAIGTFAYGAGNPWQG